VDHDPALIESGEVFGIDSSLFHGGQKRLDVTAYLRARTPQRTKAAYFFFYVFFRMNLGHRTWNSKTLGFDWPRDRSSLSLQPNLSQKALLCQKPRKYFFF
jgi:hypothetical protein